MTLVPLTDCCLHLGIDPKTLRGWLKAAHLSPCLHPADARVKCLTPDQLSRLAAFRRLLLSADQALAPLLTSPGPERLAAPPLAAGTPSESPELRHQLALLQAQVATLQAQVAELALALLRAPGSPQTAVPVPASPPAPTSQTAQRALRLSRPPSSPAPQSPQARSHVLPLIEVRPDGTPVIISPTEGVLTLVADSPDWFAWLASLKSFSFRCVHGQFHANRRFDHGKPVQLWNLRRRLHGRSSELYLGPTHTLTLSRLLEKAATLSARLTGS